MVFVSAKPVLNFLRALGVFPFTRKEPGEAKFKLMSGSMAYSMMVFTFLIVSISMRIGLQRSNNNIFIFMLQTYVVFIAINRINIVRSLEGRFEEAVIAYLFLVNILPVCIIPLIWMETGKFAVVLNDWTEFEILYYKVAGQVLPLEMKTKGLVVAILLPILSSLSVIVTHVTMVDFQLLQVCFCN